MAQADAFLVICEVGLFNFTTSRYTLESEARDAAKTFWCCWVLYKQTANGTDLTELDSGGVGFSHPNIRVHAEKNVKTKAVSQARDADARASAAAAAEARMAKLAHQQPKPKARPAGGGAAVDGRPDVSNPAVWD